MKENLFSTDEANSTQEISGPRLPFFSAELNVDQRLFPHRLRNISAFLVFGISLFLPAFVADSWFNISSNHWLLALAMAVGIIVGLFLCIAIFAISERFSSHKEFYGRAKVTIDLNGITVSGLGKCAWSAVKTFEGIPDSSYGLLIYTIPFGTLLIKTDTPEQLEDGLLPAVNFYLSEPRSFGKEELMQQCYRIFLFNESSFDFFIHFGYIAGAVTLLVFALISASEGLKYLIGILILPPGLAYCIWQFAFSQLSPTSVTKKILNLHVKRDELVIVEISFKVKFEQIKLTQIHKKGIGYEFDCVYLKEKYREVCLIPCDENWQQLVLFLKEKAQRKIVQIES